MNKFKRKSSIFSIENMAKTIIIFVVIMIILSFVGQGVLAYLIVTKPEMFSGWIGDFLGNIISSVETGGE